MVFSRRREKKDQEKIEKDKAINKIKTMNKKLLDEANLELSNEDRPCAWRILVRSGEHHPKLGLSEYTYSVGCSLTQGYYRTTVKCVYDKCIFVQILRRIGCTK